MRVQKFSNQSRFFQVEIEKHWPFENKSCIQIAGQPGDRFFFLLPSRNQETLTEVTQREEISIVFKLLGSTAINFFFQVDIETLTTIGDPTSYKEPQKVTDGFRRWMTFRCQTMPSDDDQKTRSPLQIRRSEKRKMINADSK